MPPDDEIWLAGISFFISGVGDGLLWLIIVAVYTKRNENLTYDRTY